MDIKITVLVDWNGSLFFKTPLNVPAQLLLPSLLTAKLIPASIKCVTNKFQYPSCTLTISDTEFDDALPGFLKRSEESVNEYIPLESEWKPIIELEINGCRTHTCPYLFDTLLRNINGKFFIRLD